MSYFRFYEINKKMVAIPEKQIKPLCYIKNTENDYIARFRDMDQLVYKIYGELLSENWLNNHLEQDILQSLLKSCEYVEFPCISKDMLCVCYNIVAKEWEIFNLSDLPFDEVWIKPANYGATEYITLSNLKRLEDNKKCS